MSKPQHCGHWVRSLTHVAWLEFENWSVGWSKKKKICVNSMIQSCVCVSKSNNSYKYEHHALLPAACPVLASSPPNSRMLCSLTRTASSSLSWMSRFTTKHTHTHIYNGDVILSVLTWITAIYKLWKRWYYTLSFCLWRLALSQVISWRGLAGWREAKWLTISDLSN